MRYFVLAVLALILLSLGSALYYLIRDQGRSGKVVQMLAIRVGLSIALFVILLASYKLGFVTQRIG
jgi:formate/nitrite transporter FocA (FNT family)